MFSGGVGVACGAWAPVFACSAVVKTPPLAEGLAGTRGKGTPKYVPHGVENSVTIVPHPWPGLRYYRHGIFNPMGVMFSCLIQ